MDSGDGASINSCEHERKKGWGPISEGVPSARSAPNMLEPRLQSDDHGYICSKIEAGGEPPWCAERVGWMRASGDDVIARGE